MDDFEQFMTNKLCELEKSFNASATVRPYVYKFTHKKSGKFYFGFRSANIVPAGDDLVKIYKSSCPEVKCNVNDFDAEVIAEFSSPQLAYEFEQYLISAYWNDALLINCRRVLKPRYKKQTTATKDRMSNSHTGLTHSDVSKKKMSDLKMGVKRKPFTDETLRRMGVSQSARWNKKVI